MTRSANSGALLNFYQEMNLYHESIKYSLIQETSEICKVLTSWVFHILGLEDFCNFRNNFLKELFFQGKKKGFYHCMRVMHCVTLFNFN